MQFIIFSKLVKFYLTFNLILIFINQFHIVNGLTFSSFLSNLESTTQDDLANLQHSSNYLNSDSNSNIEHSCEELKSCNDLAGFEAIKWLHKQLDDDQDGNVDMAESSDFFKTDLNHSDANEKQLQFHGNDKHISIEDLWFYWIRSEVHNWTIDQAVEWLHNSAELGQYEETFRANKIDGKSFPRLASLQSPFLSVTLGIKDPIHKQKIALKAMDLVLFGVPKTHNYFKDLLLVFSFLVAMLGVCYASLQRKNSQNHLKKMLKDMEALQKAEQQLGSLQEELFQAKQEKETAKTEKIKLEENLLKEGSYPHFYLRNDQSLPNVGELNKICELEEELRLSKDHVARLEDSIEKKQWAPPAKLQYWLQLTHELELKNHNAKRQAAELQLLAAKEGCEKLKKKRSSFLGSFRVAHGSSIDDVDNRILQAKESLAEVTKDLQERLYRWRQIEKLCNFTIQQNRGEIFLQHELYKQLISNSKKNHQSMNNTLHNNSMQRTGSEGTIIESEDSFGTQPVTFSTVQQLFQHSFGLMTLPVLDPNIYGNNFTSIGNDLNDRFYDACDQYPLRYLTNTTNNNQLPNYRSHNFKSVVKSNKFKKLLNQRRFSENVISKSNLLNNNRLTNGLTNGYNTTISDYCSNMNIANLPYSRLHPVLSSEKIFKPSTSFNQPTKNVREINMHDKKPIQNGNFDEDSTTSEEYKENSERKPQFAVGDVALKENLIQKNGFKTNGKSNYQDNKDEDLNQSIANDSDYLNNSSFEQSKSSTADFDLSKASKKRKSYKFFSGLRKRGSKYSSQESH